LRNFPAKVDFFWFYYYFGRFSVFSALKQKSTFAEKISNFSMDQFSPYYGKKYFFPSKTSLDRLKLIYKTKKKWEKNNFVKAQTTAMWMGEEH
jgi:hypothetical protein